MAKLSKTWTCELKNSADEIQPKVSQKADGQWTQEQHQCDENYFGPLPSCFFIVIQSDVNFDCTEANGKQGRQQNYNNNFIHN